MELRFCAFMWWCATFVLAQTTTTKPERILSLVHVQFDNDWVVMVVVASKWLICISPTTLAPVFPGQSSRKWHSNDADIYSSVEWVAQVEFVLFKSSKTRSILIDWINCVGARSSGHRSSKVIILNCLLLLLIAAQWKRIYSSLNLLPLTTT